MGKRPEELNELDFTALSASPDQPVVIQIAWQAIEQWAHSSLGLDTILDLNTARGAIEKKRLFCFPYATLNSIFSNARGFPYQGEGVHIRETGIILIPEYPMALLEELNRLAEARTRMSSEQVRELVLDMAGEYIYDFLIRPKNLARKFVTPVDCASAQFDLRYLIRADHKDAFYKIIVAEELGHLLAHTLIRGAPEDLGVIYTEVIANGLSRATVTDHELARFAPLVQWDFQTRCLGVLQSLIRQNVLSQMAQDPWSETTCWMLRSMLPSHFHSDHFDPHHFTTQGQGEEGFF